MKTKIPCKEWAGCRTKGRWGGYGRSSFNGSSRLAHRVIWEETYGPIPRGMCVLHSCDNPPCIELEHLFLGNKKDNSQDMIRKGRMNFRPAQEKAALLKREKMSCPQGHPYSGDNLVLASDSSRRCHKCRNAASLRYYHRHKKENGIEKN